MKYYETPHKKNRRSGLIVAVALCLVAVGAVLWQVTAGNRIKKAMPKSAPLPQVSYSDNTSSYNDTTEPPAVSSDVAGSVEEVPYESESQPAEEPQPAAPSYTLPLEGKIIKHHSDTALQYSATYGDLRLHNGVDIAAKSGATVIAADGGTVTAFEEN
ncbi:MAG: M23 family metallopeptidase, partial [Clostridia bacterium]|nr:M23 family metallopeptidase [Clostridia bacterium]